MHPPEIVSVLKGVIPHDLRDRRLQREHVEGTLAAIVPVRPLRSDRQEVGKVESWKNVVLAVGWNTGETKISCRRLINLESSKFEHRPTAPEVEDEV